MYRGKNWRRFKFDEFDDCKNLPIFSQPNFIVARDHPHSEYDIHEKEGPAEPPLTH